MIEDIPDTFLSNIIDPATTDKNCASIQTVLSHIVSSGYWYAIYIYNLKENKTERPETVFHTTIKEYLQDFNKMKVYAKISMMIKLKNWMKPERYLLHGSKIIISRN